MTDTHSDLPQLPLKLSNLAVIGVTQPQEGNWARLRALQYSRLEALSLTRFLAHAIALVLTISIFLGKASPLILAGWVVALVAVLWNASRVDDGLRDVDRRAMTKGEYAGHALSVALVAAVWVIPCFLFEPQGGMEDRLAFWAITAMLITGTTLAFAATPVATLVFAGVTGTAAIVSFAAAGSYGYAALAASFCGIAMGGAIRGARTYLSARIAEAGVAEKSEVVSLLLREFEDTDADWLWQIDTARRVRSASSRFVYALGKELSEIEGKSFVQLIAGSAWDSGQFPPSLHDLAERLKRRESFSNLLVQVSIGVTKRWWELSGTPIIDENGTFHGFRGVGSDVTEQRESDEKIAYLARYDTLTGLPNRLMLTEALGEALRYADQWRTRCAFLMIDLDRFKAVNDSLGHHVGDQLLAQVSARLKSLISDNELCGRLGGDEFAIVIRDASDRTRVEKVARAVIDHLSLPYDVDHHTLYVGASVGSALGPRDGDTVETLMRNADLALYRAKDEGGSVHWNYEPSLHADAEERRQLEFALRRALDRNELFLQYQPVVDARSETVVSFEALLRWNSAEHGFISPMKFIPLAEDTRLILPIGDWVLREACREALNWPSHVRVAVNVSGEQLLDPQFASKVVAALAATGLPANRLEIEVTESIFVRDGATARATLEQIMALGCSIALDDFGTGYSSLGYLRKLRFSTIKVDRSFVQGAAKDNAESLAIIRAVVAMAQSLDMATTAEGVETAEEAALIRELGCTKIQGYYFGRPMDAVDAIALFRTMVARGAAA
ncbi:MAG TPA: EAL domain-containing protein [Sphingomonadaceae bacterium]|nr:EAL domain-containing protein [Sphingomonadaceae bacterium]